MLKPQEMQSSGFSQERVPLPPPPPPIKLNYVLASIPSISIYSTKKSVPESRAPPYFFEFVLLLLKCIEKTYWVHLIEKYAMWTRPGMYVACIYSVLYALLIGHAILMSSIYFCKSRGTQFSNCSVWHKRKIEGQMLSFQVISPYLLSLSLKISCKNTCSFL